MLGLLTGLRRELYGVVERNLWRDETDSARPECPRRPDVARRLEAISAPHAEIVLRHVLHAEPVLVRLEVLHFTEGGRIQDQGVLNIEGGAESPLRILVQRLVTAE